MADEPAVTKSFKLPKAFADALNSAAKDAGQSVSEYVRDLVIRELTKESREDLDTRNAEELRAIRALANLLRDDFATVAKLLLRGVVKLDEAKADEWLRQKLHR